MQGTPQKDQEERGLQKAMVNGGKESKSESEMEMGREKVDEKGKEKKGKKGKGKGKGKRKGKGKERAEEKPEGSSKPGTHGAPESYEVDFPDLSGAQSPEESAGGEQALRKRRLKKQKREALIARRSKLETCMDILRAMADGYQKPTHIMYKANLSWVRMQRYLRLLVDQGYVRRSKSSEGILYCPTEKGIKLLAYFQRAQADLQALLVGNPAERRAKGILSLIVNKEGDEGEEGGEGEEEGKREANRSAFEGRGTK